MAKVLRGTSCVLQESRRPSRTKRCHFGMRGAMLAGGREGEAVRDESETARGTQAGEDAQRMSVSAEAQRAATLTCFMCGVTNRSVVVVGGGGYKKGNCVEMKEPEEGWQKEADFRVHPANERTPHADTRAVLRIETRLVLTAAGTSWEAVTQRTGERQRRQRDG
ncbi:hypothetical protein JZ751_005769 [Albula glossodonta]|uniref:Uncharacterized protein n=1 Tax=Albula glossodonta TaxID=121402 RepID=A0A8T2N4E9_9TELE|nr:hypothetical protein JZ751_005769 [Albula glossodonta]